MKHTYVKDDPRKGKALHAARAFNRGEIVLTFEGAEVLATNGPHTLQIGFGEHLVVDEPGRYVNHSCDPNCGILGVRTLVALRLIEKDEELTFDYAMSELETVLDGKKCLCGSAQCRGVITGYRGLPQALKAKYRAHVSHYLRELDEHAA